MAIFTVTLSDPNYPKPPHCRHFVPPSESSLWCQAAASPAPLAASASMHLIQDHGDDAKGSHDRWSSLPKKHLVRHVATR